MSPFPLPFVVLLLSLLAPLCHARPGLWFRSSDEVAVRGSQTLVCTDLYLGLYGAERSFCGSCSCPELGFDRIIALKRGVSTVKFDHTLSTIVVDGVSYDIPNVTPRFGCETDDVKAVRFRCQGEAEILLLSDRMPHYECQESRFSRRVMGLKRCRTMLRDVP